MQTLVLCSLKEKEFGEESKNVESFLAPDS